MDKQQSERLEHFPNVNSLLKISLGLILFTIISSALVYAETETVNVGGNSFDVDYTATGMTVSGIEVLDEGGFASLIFTVDVTDSSGTLDITFDRSFFDSTFEGLDDPFLVLIDDIPEDSSFTETETTSQSRTLSIVLSAGTETVEIIGSVFGESASVEEPPVVETPPEPEPEPVKTADDQYKIICSAPDSYCTIFFHINNPDSYGACLGTWVPFCQTYETKQPEPVPEPEILEEVEIVCPQGFEPINGKCPEKPVIESSKEVEIVCGKGTVLIDHICQVEQSEEKREYTLEEALEIQRQRTGTDKPSPVPEPEYPQELTPEIIEEMEKIGERLNAEEKPSKKSVNWFSSLFDWLGGLFQ